MDQNQRGLLDEGSYHKDEMWMWGDVLNGYE